MRRWMVLLFLAAATASAYTVAVNASDVRVTPITTGEFAGFDVVTLDGGVILPVTPGLPSLPGKTVSIALPHRTKINAADVRYLDPVTLPGKYNVLPTQPPRPIGEPAAPLTPPDAAAYASAEAFPGNVAPSFNSGNMSGYAVGSVCLAPVQYIPKTREIVVYRTVEIDLHLTSADAECVYPRVRMSWIDEQLREDIALNVINPYEVMSLSGVNLVDEVAASEDAITVFPYLIITNDAQATAAETLLNWKRRKGIYTVIEKTSDINNNYAGVDLAEKIRNCIKYYYENCGTQYICIVGTAADVPIRKVYDAGYDTLAGDGLIATDNYYGCLDGTFNANNNSYWGEYSGDNVDWLYDVYVGRIETSAAAAFTEVSDKTRCYEGSPSGGFVNPYDYLGNTTLAGAWLDSSTNCGLLMQNIRDNFLTASHWSFNELWDTSYPGGSVFSSSAFVTAMNQGKNVIAHAAHSNSTVIGTNSGSVTSTNLYNLTNGPRFTGTLYSLGCYSCDTDYANNCGAYFVNAPSGGGPGYVGNTRYGWYAPGSPASGYSADFENEYFKQFGVNDVYVSGRALALHKHALQSMVSDVTYRYIYYELTQVGDPELWLVNGPIVKFKIDKPVNIPTGPTPVTITVRNTSNNPVSGALVCLWKKPQYWDAKTTNASGVATFTADCATAGMMYCTVSAHNHRTLLTTINVGTAGGTSLLSFRGTRTDGGARLQWQVSPGADVTGFYLLRRPVNGAASAMIAADAALTADEDGWVLVNNSAVTGASSFVDRNAPDGAVEYKLIAVCAGERLELGTTTVEDGHPVAFGMRVGPNPASSVAYLTVSLPSSSAVKVVVYDLAGRVVDTVVDRHLSAGTHKIPLTVASYAPGIYLVRLEGCGSAAAAKVAVTR